MSFEKYDLGVFRNSIEYLKRNNKALGNIIMINKYGKVAEIEFKELKNSKYEKILKGFL